MKTLLMIMLSVFTLMANGQDAKTTMDKRARDLHQAITSNNKQQWKKFIRENYTQALIDKPMRAKVVTSENGNATTSNSEDTPCDNLEAKATMFQRLHNDFGNSKIVSLKPDGEKTVMTLENANGLSGIITLKFENKKPWLIDGLGIEVTSGK